MLMVHFKDDLYPVHDDEKPLKATETTLDRSSRNSPTPLRDIALWRAPNNFPEPLLDSALSRASYESDIATVLNLLQSGVSPNEPVHGMTALHSACVAEDTAIILVLLDNGADLDAHDGVALRCAAERGSIDIVSFLLDKGANPNIIPDSPILDYRDVALCKALSQNHKDVAALLLDRGTNVETREVGCRALYWAAKNQDKEMVRKLRSCGAKRSEEWLCGAHDDVL